MAPPKDVLSFNETVVELKCFLEVAFHTILYVRQIYPPEIFEKKRRYGMLVWQSRHPTLNEYLGQACDAIAAQLALGAVHKVTLVVKETATLAQEPLERFIFDFDWLVSPEQIAAASSSSSAHTNDFRPQSGGFPRARLEDELRAFVLKIITSDAFMLALPQETTFAIVIELNEHALAPDAEPARRQQQQQREAGWIPAEARYAPRLLDVNDLVIPIDDDDDDDNEEQDARVEARGEKKRKKKAKEPRLTCAPLKDLRFGLINMQMMVEEMAHKFELEVAKRQGSQVDDDDDDDAVVAGGQARGDKGKGRAVRDPVL